MKRACESGWPFHLRRDAPFLLVLVGVLRRSRGGTLFEKRGADRVTHLARAFRIMDFFLVFLLSLSAAAQDLKTLQAERAERKKQRTADEDRRRAELNGPGVGLYQARARADNSHAGPVGGVSSNHSGSAQAISAHYTNPQDTTGRGAQQSRTYTDQSVQPVSSNVDVDADALL